MRRFIRLIPTLVDFAIVYLVALAIWVSRGWIPPDPDHILPMVLVFVGVTVLYNAIADIVFDGRSLGKWSLGFVPLGLDGKSPTKGQHVRRFAFKLLGLGLFRGSRDDGIPLHDQKAGMAFVSRLMLLQPPAAAGWTLRILSGSLAKKAVLLDRLSGFQRSGEVNLGRDPDWADVPLIDHGVSRKHAQIKASRQGLLLVDLDSRNGTTLDRHRLPPHRPTPVRSRSKIMIGPIPLLLEHDKAGEEPWLTRAAGRRSG